MEIRQRIRRYPAVEWIAWVGVSLLAGVVGSAVTVGAVQTWYPTLVQPSFAPPNWVFGPVWTALYILMGTGAFLVARSGDTRAQSALVVFLVQLVFNLGWSLAFFGLQSPLLGLVVIVPLVLLIGVTAVGFGRIDWRAGALLVPYLAWTGFATVLNYQFWVLN
jgi:tryptophan-rich sensory protein